MDSNRSIISDGPHSTEVLRVLESEISDKESLKSIQSRAVQVVRRAVDPIAGPPASPSDGLLYGLIQSGKTSIITVAAAMAADNGFDCILILTSDIDLLYDQTIDRLRRALRGLSVLGKNDWKDMARFERQLRTKPFVIVCSKNGSRLNNLLEAFKKSRARGLSVLIIDDEADQASLNTQTAKSDGQISKINDVITSFRDFFPVNTYLQVTATPQALFLQRPDHRYRPSFTVLSAPGEGYVGGDAFFGANAGNVLREIELHEVEHLLLTNQPIPGGKVPKGLRKALVTFLVAATVKVLERPAEGFAFLCHVSVSTKDHQNIVRLIDRVKEGCLTSLAEPGSSNYVKLEEEFKAAYDDLSATKTDMPPFAEIVEKIRFFLNGANVKLVNALSDDEIKLDSVYNIFVGGNKLGRGVTIKNLLVSYYGRNPKKPNADTVLQHARMYGYRGKDIDVTRLFLPSKLADHFRLIHQMESSLRDLVEKYPEGNFEGIYVSTPLSATRRNVLDPNSLGLYIAGRGYNPAYPLRSREVQPNTKWIDEAMSGLSDNHGHEVKIDLLMDIIERCPADPVQGIELWNQKTLKSALEVVKTLFGDTAYVVLKREMNAVEPRRETQGIITGKGEAELAPSSSPTLFLHRQVKNNTQEAVWWPQLRFPDGNYVLAFSFNW